MKARQSEYPGRVKATHEDGTTERITLEMDDAPLVEGDPFDPEHVLPDAVAALFGFDDTAVPADVFRWLGQYNRHTWRSCSAVTTAATIKREQFTPEGTYDTSGSTIHVASTFTPTAWAQTPKRSATPPGCDMYIMRFAEEG